MGSAPGDRPAPRWDCEAERALVRLRSVRSRLFYLYTTSTLDRLAADFRLHRIGDKALFVQFVVQSRKFVAAGAEVAGECDGGTQGHFDRQVLVELEFEHHTAPVGKTIVRS